MLTLLLIGGASPVLRAQEPVRASLSRVLGTNVSLQPPENVLFRVGPFQGNLFTGVALDYTDNAGLTNTGTSSRLRLYETLDLDVLWPITIHNQLHVRLGAFLGENLVGSGGNQFTLALAPDSEISWAVGVGDFRIRLFDRFAVIQDPTTDPTITNVFDLNRIRNDAGFTVDWDLNKVILTWLTDDTYVTQNARTTNQGVPQNLSNINGDRNTLRTSLQAGFVVTPTITVGPVVSVSETSGSGAAEIDAVSPGLFLNARLTRLTTFELEGGYNFISAHLPTTGVTILNQQAPSSTYYVRASLRQTVSRFLDLLASVSHDLDYAEGLNVTERTLVNVGVSYRLNKRTSLNVTGSYEDGTVFSGGNAGDYSYFSVAAGAVYQLGPRVSASLRYRYTERTSNNSNVAFVSDGRVIAVPSNNGSYSQNEVTLSLNYAF